ncbi:MAG TPA: lysophospholipase [Burkholderiales bacterium]|nr:lysophospholipase [Burkholderiales bacterium]
MVKHQEGFFTDAHGSKRYYQFWLPESPPKAVLLLVHGLAEHSGRYANLVSHLVPRGYAVYAMDHVGHGKSDGARTYVERFGDFVESLRKYFGMIRAWQPEVPIFLIGHSLGGLIAATYLLEHPDGLQGAILSGPAVRIPDNISPVTIFAGKILSALFPGFGVLGLDARGVSRDPAVVTAYLNDPLVFTGKVTARLGAEMLKAMRRMEAEAHRIRLPILILQGSADKLVDPAGARMLHERVGSADKTLNVYEGLYHEVYNEPEHGRVLRDVESWLEKRLPLSLALSR